MITALAQAVNAVPAYCSSGYGVLTPAQWKTCWNAGWSQPVNTAVNAGPAVNGGLVVAIGIVIVLILIIMAKSRTPATN